MLRPYLKILDWDLIFGRAVKAIPSPGVRSPWSKDSNQDSKKMKGDSFKTQWKLHYPVALVIIALKVQFWIS